MSIIYLYKSLVLSQIEYADVIYDGLSHKDCQFLQRIQNKALKSILHLDKRTPTDVVHEMAGIEPLKERRRQHVCTQVYKGIHDLSTPRVNEMFECVGAEHERTTRSVARQDVQLPRYKLKVARRSIAYRGGLYYNDLDTNTRAAQSVNVFKKRMCATG